MTLNYQINKFLCARLCSARGKSRIKTGKYVYVGNCANYCERNETSPEKAITR